MVKIHFLYLSILFHTRVLLVIFMPFPKVKTTLNARDAV